MQSLPAAAIEASEADRALEVASAVSAKLWEIDQRLDNIEHALNKDRLGAFMVKLIGVLIVMTILLVK